MDHAQRWNRPAFIHARLNIYDRQNILLQQASFQDLEEMTTDDQYLYLGNFGNNATGNLSEFIDSTDSIDSLHDSTSMSLFISAMIIKPIFQIWTQQYEL